MIKNNVIEWLWIHWRPRWRALVMLDTREYNNTINHCPLAKRGLHNSGLWYPKCCMRYTPGVAPEGMSQVMVATLCPSNVLVCSHLNLHLSVRMIRKTIHFSLYLLCLPWSISVDNIPVSRIVLELHCQEALVSLSCDKRFSCGSYFSILHTMRLFRGFPDQNWTSTVEFCKYNNNTVTKNNLDPVLCYLPLDRCCWHLSWYHQTQKEQHQK